MLTPSWMDKKVNDTFFLLVQLIICPEDLSHGWGHVCDCMHHVENPVRDRLTLQPNKLRALTSWLCLTFLNVLHNV